MAVDESRRAALLEPTPARRRHDPALRLDGADLQDGLPMVLARLQGEVAGHENHLRPHSPQRQVLLAEAHVVADGQAEGDAADFAGDEPVAGTIQCAFAVPRAVGAGDIEEVDLSVAGDLGAGPVEHDRGVEQGVRPAFDDAAAMHRHTLASHRAHELVSLAAGATRLGQQLRRTLPRLTPTTQIGPGLRQADHIGPVRRQGRLDQAARLIDVAPLVASLVHLHDADPHGGHEARLRGRRQRGRV